MRMVDNLFLSIYANYDFSILMTYIREQENDMTRFEALQAQRNQAHQAVSMSCWQFLSDELEDIGVEHRLFGSFASGQMMDHSDIDLMIMGELSEAQRLSVRRAVNQAVSRYQVPIDLHFSQDMTLIAREALLAD